MSFVYRVVAGMLCVAVTAVDARAFGVGIHADITKAALDRFIATLPPSSADQLKRGFTTIAQEEIAAANKAIDTGHCGKQGEDVPATPCTRYTSEGLAALDRLLRNQAPPEEHFDAEKIQEGSNRIFNAVDRIRSYLKQGRFAAARRELGGVLHSIQDFYAHTNFVEIRTGYPFEQMFEERLGARLNAFS